jgi:hypothetical protein
MREEKQVGWVEVYSPKPTAYDRIAPGDLND